LFEVALETRDVLLPESPILLCPCRDIRDSGGLELIDPLTSLLFFANEPGAPQHTKVSGDRRPADAKPRRELGHRRAPETEAIENRPARRIGYGMEDICVG
jgi:hypothetical protein